MTELNEQLKRGLGKQYRMNNIITVGEAVGKIRDDLDVDLAQCSTEYARGDIIGFEETVHRVGADTEANKKKKVSKFLPQKYLVD